MSSLDLKSSCRHGGKREKAGRPKSEPTKMVRVPLACLDTIKHHIEDHKKNTAQSTDDYYKTKIINRVLIPLFSFSISAGIPTSGDGHIANWYDLSDLLIKNPQATFLLRVSGDSMIDAGIQHNDLIIVDKSIAPVNHCIVVAALNGQLTVKRLEKAAENAIFLKPENKVYKAIHINDNDDFVILGVVTNVIHNLTEK